MDEKVRLQAKNRDRDARPAGSILRRIGSESTIYSAGSFLNKLLMFLMVPLFSVFIPPEDLSLKSVLDPAEQFVFAMMNLGISQAFFRQYKRKREDSDLSNVISTVFWFLVGMTFVGIAVLVLFAPTILGGLVPQHPLALTCYFLALASLAIRMIGPLGIGYLQASNRSMTFVFWTLAGTVAYCLYNFVSLALFDRQINAVFEGRLLLIAPLIASGLVLLRRHLKFRIDLRLLRRMLAFSLPFTLAAAAYPVLNFFDRWMLARIVGAAPTGIYDISYTFGMIPGMLLVAPFLRSWQPAMYEIGDDSEGMGIRRHVLLYYTLIGCVMWLGLASLSSELLDVFSTSAYRSGHVIIPFVAGSQFFYGAAWVLMSGLVSKGNSLFVGVFTAGAAVTNVLLNLIWIPAYGMIGAAFATLAAFVLLFVALACYTYFKTREVWPALRFGLMLVVSVCAYFVIVSISPDSLFLRILLKVLACIPAALALTYVAGISVSNLRQLKYLIWNERKA